MFSLGLSWFCCRLNATALTTFCASPVSRARLSVKVSAMREFIRPALEAYTQAARLNRSDQSSFPITIFQGRAVKDLFIFCHMQFIIANMYGVMATLSQSLGDDGRQSIVNKKPQGNANGSSRSRTA